MEDKNFHADYGLTKFVIIMEEVHVRLKGSFYSFNTHCKTLAEAMRTYPIMAKRSWIAEWWKE